MFSDSNENIRMKLSNINPAMTRKAPIVVVCVYVRACVLHFCSAVALCPWTWSDETFTRGSASAHCLSVHCLYTGCVYLLCVCACVCACQIHVRAMHTYRWCRMDEWNKPLLDLFIHLFERMNSSYFYPHPPPPLSSSVVHMRTARLQPPAPLWPLYILMCK